MFKKFFKGFMVAGMVISLAGGTASAATHEIVGGGASAQGQFWRVAGTAFLQDYMGCSNVEMEGNAQEDAIMRGLACTNPNGVSGVANGDDILITYMEVNSGFGCENTATSITVPDPATCAWDGDGIQSGDCTGTKSANMDVGCADVRCESIDQTSSGFPKGRGADRPDNASYVEGCADGDCMAYWTSYSPDFDAWGGHIWDGVVVPFGLAVNNSVTKTRCVAPTDPVTDDIHMAYSKWGWQCVPGAQACVDGTCEDGSTPCTQNTRYELDGSGNVALVSGACPAYAAYETAGYSNDCVGYYKCDHGANYEDTENYSKDGVCMDGNQGTSEEKACQKPKDCPADVADTSCIAQPIDNLSRLQALLIFSGNINNWSHFGPWYPDLPIVQCMRHAGSGTHATFYKAFTRGDLAPITETVAAGDDDLNGNWIPDWQESLDSAATDGIGVEETVWHYTSSTDLTHDCIDYYAGGIGYVDADKVMGNDDSSYSHTIKLEGVEPTREKVKFGEYIYWSAQQCMDGTGGSGTEYNIIDSLMSYATGDQMTNENFGTTADFWTVVGEMNVTKTSDTAYPVAK